MITRRCGGKRSGRDELAERAEFWWGEAPAQPKSVREAIGVLPHEEYCYTLTCAEPWSSAESRLGAIMGLTTTLSRMRQSPWSNLVVAREPRPTKLEPT